MKKVLKPMLAILIVVVMVLILPAWNIGGSKNQVQAKETETKKLSNPWRTGKYNSLMYDTIYFGRYPQSDASGNKTDPIKWRVLSVDGNDAFLMADCILDIQRFESRNLPMFKEDSNIILENNEPIIIWENSQLRTWLNDNFFYNAFNHEERKAVKTTSVRNNKYINSTNRNNTEDKVYLPSLDEITNPDYGFMEDYDRYDAARMRKNTAYAAAGGTYEPLLNPDHKQSGKTGDEWDYWLRTETDEVVCPRAHAMTVDDSGLVDPSWGASIADERGICPVLHLDISKSNNWSYAGVVDACGKPVKHNWKLKDERKATYDSDGYKTYVCSSCGATKTETIDKIGKGCDHEWRLLAILPPAPDHSGSNTYVCNKCGITRVEWVDYEAEPENENKPENRNEPENENEPESRNEPEDANEPENRNEPEDANEPDDKKELDSKVLKTGDTYTDKKTKVKYKITGRTTAQYVKPTSKEKTYAIPDKIELQGKTYKVTSVADNAFRKNLSMTKVTIGSNVKRIGKNAFYGCKKLKQMRIKSTKLKTENVGKNAFKGINKKAAVKVPKSKRSTYEKLLQSRGLAKNVKIR